MNYGPTGTRNPDHWNTTFQTQNGPVGVVAEPYETRFIRWCNGVEYHHVIDGHMRPLQARSYTEMFAHSILEDAIMVRIDATPEGNLAFVAPWNGAAIDELKMEIPSSDRQWDKASKRWIVLPCHAATLVKIAQQFYGQSVTLPANGGKNVPAQDSIEFFEMRYLGRVKDRGSESSAYGWAYGQWRLIFPERVLRDWFGAEKRPGEAATLYSVLGIKPEAAGAEIKASWRRLARQWHPDVSREPDAAKQFRAIQTAYETLSDPARRARYDAGLALERSLRNAPGGVFNTAAGNILVAQEYSPPLRCGHVMAEGTDKLGWFVVSRILEWQDITNGAGEILVTSWPEGADNFIERWVRA